MSEESIGGILRHKDTRHVQVRLDYMLLYRNEAKAMIIRIMETWTAQKRAEWYKQSLDAKEQGNEPPEDELWVTMSYEQFSLFAYGTMKHDNIKRNVDDLVKEKHLLRRVHPTIPYGPPQYLLNIALLQKVLDEQELPSLIDDIGKIAPPRKKHTPPEKYPQGRGINTPRVGGNKPPGTGDFSYPSNNTTENYEESPNNKDDVATSAEGRNAPAENVSSFEEWKRKTDPQLPVIDTAYHIANTSDYEKDDDAPTEPRTPAVTKGQAHDHDSMGSNSLHDLPGQRVPDLGNAGIDRQVRRSAQEEIAAQQTPAASVSLSLAVTPRGDQDDTGGRQAHRSPVSLSTLTPAASCGLSATGSPPASPEARQGRNVIPRRPHGKKPAVLEITMNGMLVKGWYESARGSKIRMTEKNVVACNMLGDDENVTCLSLKAVIEHLDGLTWVKEHDFAIDIQVLADDKSRLNFEKNWPVVKRKLERRGQVSEQIDFDDYVGNGPEERAKRRVLYEEMKARGELIS